MKGIFVKVFKCVERDMGCIFVVKVFYVGDDVYDKEWIDSEIEIWRILRYCNIVYLYNFFYECSIVWVVLEFVDGKMLFDDFVNGIDFFEEESWMIM